MKRFLGRNKKKGASDRSALFLFLGLVFAGLLLTVMAQFDGQSKKTVSETPSGAPDFASVLPAGSADGAKSAELVDSGTPTYAVAYTEDGTATLGLVAWDKTLGRYTLASSVALGRGEERLLTVNGMEIERPGAGIPTLIAVRGRRSGGFPEGVVIAVREGSSLRVAEKEGEGGAVSDAAFPVGRSFMVETDLAFRDVDGNGTLEVVATRKDLSSKKKPPEETMGVHVWTDGRFAYDEKLSWALAMDRHLFPEPPAPPEPAK